MLRSVPLAGLFRKILFSMARHVVDRFAISPHRAKHNCRATCEDSLIQGNTNAGNEIDICASCFFADTGCDNARMLRQYRGYDQRPCCSAQPQTPRMPVCGLLATLVN